MTSSYFRCIVIISCVFRKSSSFFRWNVPFLYLSKYCRCKMLERVLRFFSLSIVYSVFSCQQLMKVRANLLKHLATITLCLTGEPGIKAECVPSQDHLWIKYLTIFESSKSCCIICSLLLRQILPSGRSFAVLLVMRWCRLSTCEHKNG